MRYVIHQYSCSSNTAGIGMCVCFFFFVSLRFPKNKTKNIPPLHRGSVFVLLWKTIFATAVVARLQPLLYGRGRTPLRQYCVYPAVLHVCVYTFLVFERPTAVSCEHGCRRLPKAPGELPEGVMQQGPRISAVELSNLFPPPPPHWYPKDGQVVRCAPTGCGKSRTSPVCVQCSVVFSVGLPCNGTRWS